MKITEDYRMKTQNGIMQHVRSGVLGSGFTFDLGGITPSGVQFDENYGIILAFKPK